MPVCEPTRPPAEAVIDWVPGELRLAEGPLTGDEGLAGGQGGRRVGAGEGHRAVEIERAGWPKGSTALTVKLCETPGAVGDGKPLTSSWVAVAW